MSTRFNTVHPGRAPIPGPPRFTTVVFDMSKTTGKTPGSSRSIRHHPGPSRWHYGSTPVLPGSPRSMDRGEPGSTGSPVGLGHKGMKYFFQRLFKLNVHLRYLHDGSIRKAAFSECVLYHRSIFGKFSFFAILNNFGS